MLFASLAVLTLWDTSGLLSAKQHEDRCVTRGTGQPRTAELLTPLTRVPMASWARRAGVSVFQTLGASQVYP